MSASTAPVGRRVLGDLPTNASAATHRASTQGKPSLSPAKPRLLGEILSPKSQTQAKILGLDGAQAGVLGAKRNSDDYDDAREDGPLRRKRQARESGVREPAGGAIEVRQLQVRDVPALSCSPQTSKSHIGPDDCLEAIVSPSSSCESQNNVDLNDSQNTTITVPDDPPPAQASPLTREQLYQKAREIKLRLSLASYKVRTNQIDIPISQLEIRASTTSSRTHSLSRFTLNSSQTRISQPSTASSTPNISLQEPSAEKKRPQPVDITSSPPPYCSTQANLEKLASQTNPQSPPVLGSLALGNDLTSSLVHVRAADSFLSLMGPQN
ncbi:hypothetical protein BUE80_DR009666 [Diplocarpon rosae]|nr:hypothetical protein BUE80_DR009666 [Diplocarpon rosae]